MPDGGGVFFLEEFGIRGAAAFADFLSDGSEEFLCSLEYGIAAGIFWTLDLRELLPRVAIGAMSISDLKTPRPDYSINTI